MSGERMTDEEWGRLRQRLPSCMDERAWSAAVAEAERARREEARLQDALQGVAASHAQLRAERDAQAERLRELEGDRDVQAGAAKLAQDSRNEWKARATAAEARVEKAEQEMREEGAKFIQAQLKADAAEAECARLQADFAAMEQTAASLSADVDRLSAEVERWQEASGLMCGGDPGGVTPDMLAKHIQQTHNTMRDLGLVDDDEEGAGDWRNARAEAAEARARKLAQLADFARHGALCPQSKRWALASEGCNCGQEMLVREARAALKEASGG